MLVEIAYARPDDQLIIPLETEQPLTAEEAIRRSGILQRFPEIDLQVNKIGIFGRLVALDQPLQAGDRVEIYRKLIADPKQARRRRAQSGQHKKKRP
jgi:putative ubiquitin-RnfH superfamily antitoxin RatB of RatAB toxin-antitoxin module